MITVTPRGFRAPLMHPCPSGRDGERMQLRFADLNNNPLPEPFYLCEQEGCYYHDHPVRPADLGRGFVSTDDKKRDRTPETVL